MTRRSVFLLWAAASAAAPPASAPKPRPMDLCPVCGMLVAKYPNWLATVVWADGRAAHFDGAKDLFKYLAGLKKYAPGRRPESISLVAVTDFYDLKRIPARTACYVIGSDVTGPMGHEFVPLASRADAEEFLKEHKGKRILTFDRVNPEIVHQVDHGKF
jgi:copper chaperone NosL